MVDVSMQQHGASLHLFNSFLWPLVKFYGFIQAGVVHFLLDLFLDL